MEAGRCQAGFYKRRIAMSTVRQIDDIFSSEAKGVRLVKTLVEYYKSSDPDLQHALEPGMVFLVSAIQNRLKDTDQRESLESFLSDEGVTLNP
jgi:hypothetical protein